MRHILLATLLLLVCSRQSLLADDGHFPETAAQAAAQPATETYTPGLGEFMMSVQQHHAKLWFAGKSGNWSLAGYELGEISEIFEDINRWTPVWQGHPVARLIHPMTGAAMLGLQQSIAHHDKAAFRRSFDQLSGSCSTCHTATGHDDIIIQRPVFPPLTNQRYRPVH